MAAIGAVLMGKVLGHSEAEKAFRPWWDALEDYLVRTYLTSVMTSAIRMVS